MGLWEQNLVLLSNFHIPRHHFEKKNKPTTEETTPVVGSECAFWSDSENGAKKLRDIISQFQAVHNKYFWEISSVTSMNRILSWICKTLFSENVIFKLVVCEW